MTPLRDELRLRRREGLGLNEAVGKRIVLSPSFEGGKRKWNVRYHNGMAIVRRFKKPDIFLTYTFPPDTPELVAELRQGQSAQVLHCIALLILHKCTTQKITKVTLHCQDRPDLVARLFEIKKNLLLNEIIQGGIFGKIVGYICVVEYQEWIRNHSIDCFSISPLLFTYLSFAQKRGLPHLHFLGILAAVDRLDTPEKIDAAISAEIPPDPMSYPPGPAREQAKLLEMAVLLFMVHGPCGEVNPKSVCMKDKSCSKFYPKPFCPATIIDTEKNRPVYMRRSPQQGGRQVKIMRGGKEYLIDNSHIVPHSRMLLLRFWSHINVEICTSCGGKTSRQDCYPPYLISQESSICVVICTRAATVLWCKPR